MIAGTPPLGQGVLNAYGMHAREELYDHASGVRMLQDAVHANFKVPAYRVTQIRTLTDMGHLEEALRALLRLQPFNVGWQMDEGIAILNESISTKEKIGLPNTK